MNIKPVINGLFIGLFLLNGLVCAESAGIAVLEKYIKIGLKSNLALKQQEFSLKKSLKALREARGMFLPSISIEARYSRAGGGRVIDMPIGDMVNPIHMTLNQLLMFHGSAPVYPANIPNQRIPFLRETEHDTKLRVVQPVFQPAIYYNAKIKKDLTGIERAKLSVFKRQLTADIKNAYFTYLQTVKIKQLLDNTRELLEENLRLNQSLFRNHKVTEEVVFRSKAELSKLDQQMEEAEKNKRMAAGFVAKVRIEPSAREAYFVVPVDCIVEGEGNYGTVFTVAVKVNIEVAHIFPETAAVRSGLENIQTVVTSGAAYLRDGSSIRVIE